MVVVVVPGDGEEADNVELLDKKPVVGQHGGAQRGGPAAEEEGFGGASGPACREPQGGRGKSGRHNAKAGAAERGGKRGGLRVCLSMCVCKRERKRNECVN
jgi:hypothetical protein